MLVPKFFGGGSEQKLSQIISNIAITTGLKIQDQNVFQFIIVAILSKDVIEPKVQMINRIDWSVKFMALHLHS